MNPKAEVAVTLAPELLQRLRDEAKSLGIDLEWLIASLVVDTFERPELCPVRA